MRTTEVTSRWWTLVVRGIFAIAFGVLTIMAPYAASGDSSWCSGSTR